MWLIVQSTNIAVQLCREFLSVTEGLYFCQRPVCLVLITVGLGLICVLLLVFIILQHNTITAERDLIKSYKNTAEEFNQTINSLQDNYTDLMTEKHQLQNNFNSLSQKNLELETKVNDLTAEKKQLQGNNESLSQKKLELETRVNDLTAEKSQLQRDFNSLNEKKLELERRVTSLSEELKKEASKRGHFIKCILLCGSGWFFMSSELKSWSDSRQYCRDHGADLIIIKSEEKQVSLCECLLMNERNHTYSLVWIGLSDSENEGIMKWVDNSPLTTFVFVFFLVLLFWIKGEPNDEHGIEDCIELTPSHPALNWNDLPCSEMRKGFCEK
uniref:C-type lectin domain-containing protein n=1 Tax=Cyprinus carpio TaxID=7962 RepID=A0A8C2D079_CYPCA